MINKNYPLPFLASFLTISLVHTGLPAANRVVLKTRASDEFTRLRATDASKKIMTYQFMKGKYNGGTTKDITRKRVTEDSRVEMGEIGVLESGANAETK